MASKNMFKLVLFFLLLSTCYTGKSSLVDTNNSHLKRVELGKMTRALSEKGYSAMTLTLEMTLGTLIACNTTTESFTIFCPNDKAFLSSKYPQPPLTLLQYHVVPSKLDNEVLRSSSLSLGCKVDTLLPGHPLVITTILDSGQYSMNDVKITDLEIYNDGFVIVHGIEDFFDPAYQTLRYPWYDVGVTHNYDVISTSGRSGTSDSGKKGCTSCEEGINEYSYRPMKNWNFIFLMIVLLIAAVSLIIVLTCLICNRRRDDAYMYVPEYRHGDSDLYCLSLSSTRLCPLNDFLK